MTLADRVFAVAVVAFACIGSARSVAHAQSAEAEALFRDGRGLIKTGKLAAGCDKFAASERLESSVGTLLNLGDCREKLGKLASAWAAFRKAEALAQRTGGDERRQAEANRRAALLEPRLPYLVIEVEHRVDGLIVRRDGEIVDHAAWNTALPVDPGTYTILAEAPGHVPWRTTVTIAAGDARHVVAVGSLAPVAAAAPPGPRAAPSPPPARPAVEVDIGAQRSIWSTTRVASVAVAAAGAGALGAGVYFGLHARDLEHRSDQRCPTAACNDLQGLRLNDQARTSASRANLLYIAGGATLAAAAVMWFVGAPGEVAVAPAAGDHRVGVAVTGRW
jgi:hypothetical protein